MSTRLTYEIVTVARAGASRSHAYSPETELRPGDIVALGGRFWLIAELEDWKATATPAVQERLYSDLRSFRDDIEGDHDEIEEWDFLMGRVFAAIGSVEDESNPARGYGWMCRLVDAEALGAAGFDRVRKAELLI